jgi:RimJ/RimL family protein N-acetyltransferase
VRLREVRDEDLPAFYEHQADPAAHGMADFPPRDREAFDGHWERIRSDAGVVIRTIESEGVAAGNVLSWPHEGKRLVGYWVGREFWGRGLASAALAEFLELLDERPLYAQVAAANAGSLRVLEKCGFTPAPGDREDDRLLQLSSDSKRRANR